MANDRDTLDDSQGSDNSYVASLARDWAANDPLERWVNSAPSGDVTTLAETIASYLAQHNPFPDDLPVDVTRRGTADETWEHAVIVERVGNDEWIVEFDDGGQAFRDHHELRFHTDSSTSE